MGMSELGKLAASVQQSNRKLAEDAAWRDAYYIAWVGAANPVATARTLADRSSGLLREIGTDGVRKHVALRAIAGHLAYLYGFGLGPESGQLDQVEANARRLGLIEPCNDAACREQGCPEHPTHMSGDHTYEQHHSPSEHVGDGPCRCNVYTETD